MAGRIIFMGNIAVVGVAGFGVGANALSADGQSGEALTVTIGQDGAESISTGITAEPSGLSGVTPAGVTGDECTDSTYILNNSGGEHDNHQWYWNPTPLPSYLTPSNALDRIRQGGGHIVTGTTDCGNSLTANLSITYMGTTSKRAGMSSTPNSTTCTGRDGQNTVDFGDLAEALIALNCYYFTAPLHELTESDIRFNNDPSEAKFYATDTEPATCNGRYDLEGIATHERGHTFGLSDLNSAAHPNLTMRGSGLSNCSRKMRSLGKGDILGLNAMY